ncbi:MAG: carbon-nitrogen hydrolase family protein [gamma proteobacterium symbiont of Taylorina sp.]|nr:carbon-nitrogen hydrolase family protein [gamma proteobacterium symbiont of Taylorina sp.]
MTKVAIIQQAPVLLDKKRTIQKVVSLVEEAASHAAKMIIFPEAFIPGYPSWIWRLRPGSDWDLTEEIHSLLLKNAVNLDDDDLLPLYDAAKEHGITIVCGIDERESQLSRTTLYNTVIIINPDGELQNKHRKLMPTNPERMVWGFGDASGLKVVDTPCGKIGTLICWENYMPLARYALYAQGIEIYIAPTYDSGDGWIGTLQHIAREGCCWVIGSGNALKYKDIPDYFPDKDELFSAAEEWINPGDSIVIAPGGEIIAGPIHNEQTILYAEIDSERVGIARRTLDVAGHYSRPDIFKLHINTQPQSPVSFE